MPGSLSQIKRRGTRPIWRSSSHEPSSRSSVFRGGIIRPVMYRECRTRLSNGVNDVSWAGLRSYVGGLAEATAFATVFRDTPNRVAILAFGTPSAASLLISAQSS